MPAAEHLHRPCYLNDMGPGWAAETTHHPPDREMSEHRTQHSPYSTHSNSTSLHPTCKDYFNLNVVCDSVTILLRIDNILTKYKLVKKVGIFSFGLTFGSELKSLEKIHSNNYWTNRGESKTCIIERFFRIPISLYILLWFIAIASP